MSVVIAIAAGLVVVLVGVWAWMSREVHQKERDLGTISGSWMAEHRSHERESDRQ